MSRKKKKNKRDKKKRSRPARPPLLPPDVVFVQTPPGVEKMSEVLGKFIEPYVADCGRERIKQLVDMAVMAWNAALLSESERSDFLQQLMTTISPEGADSVRALMEEMIQRKLTHFADNKRIIVSFEVILHPHTFQLQVTSSAD